jgi:hypothetical protein
MLHLANQREPMAQEDAASSGTRASRLWSFAPVAALACVFAAYLIRRSMVDLRFPVPWPDEGSFLWQALAFRDRLSLFAPEVNPEREALWMPPGFMVLEGAIFKLVPFSLSGARTLSALFVCGAVACVYACLRRLETKLLFSVLAGLFLFCPIAGMAGNVARMEGLELLTLSVGFLLCEHRRGAAVGVLLLAPLVHPNGLFGAAVGIPYFLFRARPLRSALRRADVMVLAAAAVAWLIYALHVSQHWEAFLRDMVAQLRFKQYVSASEGGQLGRLKEPVVWGSALALVAAKAFARQSGRPLGALGALGAALLVQTVTAAGWLYEVYPAFGVLVSSVVAVDAFFSEGEAVSWIRRRRMAASVVAVLVLVAFDAGAFLHNAFLERSLERAVVRRKSLSPAYVTNADEAAVRIYLESITPLEGAPPLAVQFLPDAEALMFEKLRRQNFRYVQQTFYEHRYDVLLVHESAWFPPFVRDLELIKLLFAKGGEYETRTIYERDGTERWTSYRWPRR